MISLLRLFLVIALPLFLSACGIRFTYNQLDTIIPWYLDDYIEFSDEQEALLESSLVQQLRWHRGTQLPAYAAWLRRLDNDLAGDFNRRHLNQHADQLEQYWDTLLLRLTPDLVALIIRASDEQIEDLFAAIEEENEEFQDEYVALSERDWREKHTENMQKRLNRWFGEVSTQQIRMIRDWSERLQPTASATLDYRRQWQQRLRQVLNNRRDEAALSAALQSLLTEPEQVQSSALQQAREYNTELFFDLVLEFMENSSSAQRIFLSQKILSLAEDFETLTQAD